MTLFCDPGVKWGGESIGGIRISHLSHLATPIVEVQLNESKHRKITYKVYRVEIDVSERFKKAMSAIMSADNIDALERTWKQCNKVYEACDEKQRNELDSAKSEKMEALKNAS
jgi:DNA repair photolyase